MAQLKTEEQSRVEQVSDFLRRYVYSVRYYTVGVYQALCPNIHRTKHLLSLLLFFLFPPPPLFLPPFLPPPSSLPPLSLPPSFPPHLSRFLPLILLLSFSSYSHDLRVIMDSEIGFALLHKSIENYCNPRSGTGELFPSVCTSYTLYPIPFHIPSIPYHILLVPDHLLWSILKVPSTVTEADSVIELSFSLTTQTLLQCQTTSHLPLSPKSSPSPITPPPHPSPLPRNLLRPTSPCTHQRQNSLSSH